jgi:hypothetical protein
MKPKIWMSKWHGSVHHGILAVFFVVPLFRLRCSEPSNTKITIAGALRR